MEKVRNKREEKRKKVGHAIRKTEEVMLGRGLIDYLCNELGVTFAMIAAHLDVTEKTLQTWRTRTVSDLESNSKSYRLIALYNFVYLASSFKVDKHLILSMLHEPIDASIPQSGSILSHIVKEPNSSVFKAVAPKIIREYLASQELKQKVNSLISLSDKDRDLLLSNLENPPEPNEALKALLVQSKKKSG
ncbi:MAG: hypothetical protein HY537_06715 [Deltaproteobacteria bacterium]|nr:hypothetical protein [Deltaproteobacteria bacterium]